MSCSGLEDFETVYVTGPFANSCGDCYPLADSDGDGVWTGTYSFPKGSTLEYRYIVDNWAAQEDLLDDVLSGGTCAPVTDYESYALRRVGPLNEASSTDDSYGTCTSCCGPDEVLSCDAVCLSAAMLGDTLCDYKLNCADLGFDGGDCADPLAHTLIINEFDPNQENIDTGEFIELMSISATELMLDGGWRLDVINGFNSDVLSSWTLDQDAILWSGDRVVFGSAEVLADIPAWVVPIEISQDSIQNQHEAIALYRYDGPSDEWVLADSVAWGEPIDGFGEGEPAVGDQALEGISIGRCPDGLDTGENSLDFVAMPPTPGVENLCE